MVGPPQRLAPGSATAPTLPFWFWVALLVLCITLADLGTYPGLLGHAEQQVLAVATASWTLLPTRLDLPWERDLVPEFCTWGSEVGSVVTHLGNPDSAGLPSSANRPPRARLASWGRAPGRQSWSTQAPLCPGGMGDFGPCEMTRLIWNSDQPCLLLCSTPKASWRQGAKVL